MVGVAVAALQVYAFRLARRDPGDDTLAATSRFAAGFFRIAVNPFLVMSACGLIGGRDA